MLFNKNLLLQETKWTVPKGHLLLPLLFLQNKRCVHNEGGSCTEILPFSGFSSENMRLNGLKAPSTRIRIFFNPQLFLSGYENIRVHTLCDHSVFMSNSPVHTYSDSLRIHWGLAKLSHQALVRPGLTQNRRGQHCFPTRWSCFCRCPSGFGPP